MQVTPETLREVEAAYRRYEAEVDKSALRVSAKQTYLLHAKQFVRWLKGEFQPGYTKDPSRGPS